jgi:hypothetical protein
VGLINKTIRFLEKQTTHRHYMGLLCTFEFFPNINKGKLKFKIKLKLIGTTKLCYLNVPIVGQKKGVINHKFANGIFTFHKHFETNHWQLWG